MFVQREIDSDPDFFVNGTTPDNLIDHELGHAANFSLVLNDPDMDEYVVVYEGDEFYREYKDRAIGLVDSIVRKNPKMDELYRTDRFAYKTMKEEHIANSISEYAGHNDREAIAEAFNDVSINGENARELSKEIYKTLKDILKML